MANEDFAGANKVNNSFLKPLERRLEPIVLPRIPLWIDSQHLTMLTLLWSLLILIFSYLARGDRRWLWLVSLMIICQWVTDHYDGKLGKYRDSGLVRWGYYMDHLLDYFFLCSIIIGYGFILPERSRHQLLFMLALFGAYEMSTFLMYAAIEELKISYLKFGPTEFRLALVIINALLIRYGMDHMIGALKYVNAAAVIGLAVMIYTNHKKIWRLDMARKQEIKKAQVNSHSLHNGTVQTASTMYELGSH